MSETDSKEGNGNGTPQVGALLRASRLRVGEDLRDIADVLCIRYIYLEAIEEGRYGDLPGDTYAVGFIRTYSEHLGLDGEEVIRRFKAERAGAKRSNDLSFPTPVPESGMPKGAIVFIGVLLALLVYGGWYVSTTDESILSDLISPVPDHLKHLVSGDDAKPANTPSAQSVEAPAQSQTETPNEVTTEQSSLTDTAEEVANRAAEAAREAAEAASGAVVSAAEEAATAAQPEAAPETPETSAAPAETAAAPAAETPAETAATVTSETPAESASAPVSAEPAPEPAQAEAEQTPAPSSETAGTDTPVETAEPQTPAAPETTAAPEPAPETPAEPTPAQETAETASAAPAEREPTAEELNARSLAQAGGAETPVAAPTPESETASAPANEQASAPVAAPVAPQQTIPSSGTVIRAAETSWVEVRDPNNSRILYTGLMSPGATFVVPDLPGLVLDTGNAGGLDILVDGTTVPKLGDVGAVRKGVSLNADRLKAGTASSR